jgi:hypothetical protein
MIVVCFKEEFTYLFARPLQKDAARTSNAGGGMK